MNYLCYLFFNEMQEGFWYHHAEPTYLMLVYWIPEIPHTIPANASHRVGIGALVMNDNGEVYYTASDSSIIISVFYTPYKRHNFNYNNICLSYLHFISLLHVCHK